MRALVLLSLLSTSAFVVPPLTGRVVDRASALTPAQAQTLEAQLAEHERATGHQLAVVVVDTLAGTPIEQASQQTAEAWRLGDARRDDGMLFLVALREHQMRVEVGYGLEGVVPDVVAGRILRERVAPRMAAGDIAGGIQAGVDALMKASAGETVTATGVGADDVDPFAPFTNISFVLLGQLLIAALLQRLPRGVRAPLLALGGGVAAFAISGSLVVVAAAAVAGVVLGIVPSRSFLWALSQARAGGGRSGFGGRGGGFTGGGGRFGGGGASGRW
ncbi:MAG: TPM domain-containing protein [Deltaproteobacteria bacterium]|nr:TPM domain-containing protein [Deltaproteobacteria bacterium]